LQYYDNNCFVLKFVSGFRLENWKKNQLIKNYIKSEILKLET